MTSLLPQQQTAFSALPDHLQQALLAHAEPPFTFLSSECVTALTQQLSMTQSALGLALLPFAAAFAFVPISNFYVGAVAFDSEGNAYLGANFEFAHSHIAQSIHAEQSAIAHAWARGAKDLAQLVVNYAPCGHCRQFINEVNRSEGFSLLLPDCAPMALADFLPNAFGPADLGVDARILDGVCHTALQAQLQAQFGDDTTQWARAICQHAHAPYSESVSAVVLTYPDGERVLGRYAENAAFNPSLPALQVALNYRRLQGRSWQAIARVTMAEKATTLSQRHNAQSLLQVICPEAHFDYHPIA